MAINEKLFSQLISQVSTLAQAIGDIKTVQAEPLKPIYTNESLMELLGIGKDLIKKYRDNGDLGFTNYGDKFWYTSDDVLSFLKKKHQKPFSFKQYQ